MTVKELRTLLNYSEYSEVKGLDKVKDLDNFEIQMDCCYLCDYHIVKELSINQDTKTIRLISE